MRSVPAAHTPVFEPARWLTREHWLSLLPGFEIAAESAEAPFAPLPVSAVEAKNLADLLETEGYFEHATAPWGVDFVRLAAGIETLHRAGFCPVFSFLYDDYWALITRVVSVLEAALGAPLLRLPDIWAWRVDPAHEDAGWSPHRDKGRHALGSQGEPLCLTLWLPLTPATPLNGCMYLLPKHRDPHYNTEREKLPNVPLPDVRALPAQPGAVMVWNQALLHWSSRASHRGGEPRISVSCEYQRADAPPFKTPLSPPQGVPGFEERLHLVARQMLQYRNMEPLAPWMEQWIAFMAAQKKGA